MTKYFIKCAFITYCFFTPITSSALDITNNIEDVAIIVRNKDCIKGHIRKVDPTGEKCESIKIGTTQTQDLSVLYTQWGNPYYFQGELWSQTKDGIDNQYMGLITVGHDVNGALSMAHINFYADPINTPSLTRTFYGYSIYN